MTSLDSLDRLLEISAQLAKAGIPCRVERQSSDELMLTFTVNDNCVEVYFEPGEMWFSYFARTETGEMTPEILARLLSENWSG